MKNNKPQVGEIYHWKQYNITFLILSVKKAFLSEYFGQQYTVKAYVLDSHSSNPIANYSFPRDYFERLA